MCGIAGILELPGAPGSLVFSPASAAHETADRVRSMLELVRERGPDASGVWAGDGATLGHRRLRILDLSPDADQPMVSSSGNEVVVFNGEIYNHHLLRGELESRGHRFRTRTDTEVLLHGYQEWGETLIPRLAGMFAFALLDRKTRRLLLARDRMGKKPLYYTAVPEDPANRVSSRPSARPPFVFGSNVKCVVAGLGEAPPIDYSALYEYLGLFSVPEDRCIYRGIAKLPAAHYALLDLAAGDFRLRRYWTPQLEPKIGWDDDALTRVEATFREAVRRRLESDVPLAVFLSGGIDSSLVTAFAAMERPGVTTISARFAQASHDEGEYARAVAERYGTDHHEVQVRESSLDVVPELVWQYGEPFSDSSAIAQYAIAKAARELATVVLTGDGGDELFGGYRRYTLAAPQLWLRDRVPEAALRAGIKVGHIAPAGARALALRAFDHAPDAVRGALGAMNPANPPYFLFHTWFLDRDRLLSPTFKERLLTDRRHAPSTVAENARRLPPFDQLFLADLAYWLPADMLTKVDVATMAASIEARSPLLDHEMVELAARLEWRGKVGLRQLKKGLRQLAEQLLPSEVARKPKWGFVVPVDQWIRGDSQALFREVLLGDTARARGLFEYAYVEGVLDAHVSGKVNHKHRLWSLFALELWFRMFVDGSLSRSDRLAAGAPPPSQA